MKILFVVNDSYSVWEQYAHTGICTAPKRRAIEVELTPEQIQKIGLKQVGMSGKKVVYEDIESISLINE